jgi:CAAX protease family protein
LNIPLPLLVFFAAFLAAALGVYGGLIGGIAERGGKVQTSQFALADLLVSLVLAGFCVMIIVHTAITGGEAPATKAVTPDQVLPSAGVFLLLLAGLTAFLRTRGIQVSRLLGFNRLPLMHVIGIAMGLLLAAFPLVFAAGVLMQALLNEPAQEQELVTLFREVARKADRASMTKILLAGVAVAPLAEEFLFRGYLYGVFKRYCGALWSGLLSAALFAAFHMNLASLPSLFVLAVCFTLAYEATGSLLVPIGMHALFNSTQLLVLYRQAQGG